MLPEKLLDYILQSTAVIKATSIKPLFSESPGPLHAQVHGAMALKSSLSTGKKSAIHLPKNPLVMSRMLSPGHLQLSGVDK